jgi:alpha-L-rhamnosidase
VKSEWQKEGGEFEWQITVPPNTTATAYVPATDVEAVTESGKSAKDAEGVKFVRTDGGDAVFELTSGEYRFESK